MSDKLRLLAVGAHVADVPKRAGGTLARYVKEGHKVFMATLSFGETMESYLLWRKKPGITIDEVRAIREQEFLESCKILGVEPIMLRFEDNFPLHPLPKEAPEKVAELIRRTRPHILLTHWFLELYDDHRITGKLVSTVARDLAADPKSLKEKGLEPWSVEDVYFFEPSIGEADPSRFIPDLYIDVTDVWDRKLECLKPFWFSQTDVSDYYTTAALYCGGQVGVKYAERFAQHRIRRVFKLFPTSRLLGGQ
ncbi:PIG-L family deacetylase [Candidatus Bathyarchaeota archaeon]|nr:PIG-L family deacetylase [Candidatus Bathyarchaeota archaeon]